MHSHTRFATSGHNFNGFIRIFISRKLNLQLIILTHHTSKMYSSGKIRFHFHRKMETIPPQKHQQNSQTNNTWYRKIQKTRKRKNGKWIRLNPLQPIRLLIRGMCSNFDMFILKWYNKQNRFLFFFSSIHSGVMSSLPFGNTGLLPKSNSYKYILKDL